MEPIKPFTPSFPLSPEYCTSHELAETTAEILDSHRLELENTLSRALQSYSQYELADAAREFRKLAADLKHLESLISVEGKYSPRNSLNDLSGKQWLQHSKSWVIRDGTPGSLSEEIKDHPASFPPSLAEHFISFFTKRGEWVFDPFLGIGSTLVAAQTTSRKCFGIELNPKYASYAATRVKKDETQYLISNADAREAVTIWQSAGLPPMKFLITSPPYWNMLHTSRGGVKSAQKQRIEGGYDEVYSQNEADLGNIADLGEYLCELVQLFKSFKPILEPKAYLMVILQNCRPKDGIMRPIAWQFAQALSDHYDLCQEFIWLQDQKFMGIWGYPTTYVSNVHHHYCLVFRAAKKDF